MLTIEFYEDDSGKSNVFEFIKDLDKKIILLHYFRKKSKKTPKNELKTAHSRMNEYKRRNKL
ncbi:MAG: type II toxin-antitoxin system RelE/ParE family toxin [Ruminococcus sp.]|jgi:phage-related protein|nr:type II toxin-antitoxin system RelE/ParE family toxin [Ruminococcus sp.]